MATEDPHLILTAFLPVLLFESAFAMDVHIFYRMFSQILILAIFGLVVATLLSGTMAKMVFTYQWTWFEALLFGAVISATDPVAVVALLNDLGKCQYRVGGVWCVCVGEGGWGRVGVFGTRSF